MSSQPNGNDSGGLPPSYKSDDRTEQLLRDVVLPGLAALVDKLPTAIPADLTVADSVYAVAHGFMCRVANTCRGALLLEDAGYSSEAAPLRRAALEHALALWWVLNSGKPAVAALGRARLARMSRIKDAIAGGNWTVTEADFDALLSENIPSLGEDHLVPFGQLVNRIENGRDLRAAWLSETGLSHPDDLTANVYVSDTGQLTTRARDSGGVHQTAFIWWLAASAMALVAGWTDDLRALGASVGLPILTVGWTDSHP